MFDSAFKSAPVEPWGGFPDPRRVLGAVAARPVRGPPTLGRGMWGHPGRTRGTTGEPQLRDAGVFFPLFLIFGLKPKQRVLLLGGPWHQRDVLGQRIFSFPTLSHGSPELDGAALGSLGSWCRGWVPRRSLSSRDDVVKTW